jgi:redox-sensing transcriptional repressor
LSYFGEIGKRGVGYHVDKLFEHLRAILSSPRVWRMALVGVGNWEALLGYNALRREKFGICALSTWIRRRSGKRSEEFLLSCRGDDRRASRANVEVVILTVPAHVAQSCVDKIAKSETVKGILSFAPIPCRAGPDPRLQRGHLGGTRKTAFLSQAGEWRLTFSFPLTGVVVQSNAFHVEKTF